MSAHELRRDKRRCEYRSACGSVLDWLWLPEFVLVSAAVATSREGHRSRAAVRHERLLPRSMLSVLCLGHFIGQRTDFGRSIVAGIAGLGVSNDGWERKSTISQEIIIVIALCWPEDDVDYS